MTTINNIKEINKLKWNRSRNFYVVYHNVYESAEIVMEFLDLCKRKNMPAVTCYCCGCADEDNNLYYQLNILTGDENRVQLTISFKEQKTYKDIFRQIIAVEDMLERNKFIDEILLDLETNPV